MQITFIDGIFFFYTFVGLYMSIFFITIYLRNRRELLYYPKGKPRPVSIVIPCYNEEATIGKAIESMLALDYPKEMLEIIVVDDKSADNSAKVAKKYASRYHNVRVIVNKRNSGKAAEPTNIGVKAAKYDYVVVADADSTPDKDALLKMIGFLQDDKSVGAVTCSVMVREPKSFMQRLQAIEYTVIAWERKLLDCIDAVYVTPGPFALYRKKVLLEIGLFDTTNMTQDIEIVWKMLSKGYKARMCLDAKVHSEAPTNFWAWVRQRIRWNVGGMQCISKYKKYILQKGMLGLFVVPFFTVSMFMGVFGFGLFGYLIAKRVLSTYLSTKYSVYADIAVLRFQDLSFTPSVLNFFGVALFFLGLFLAVFALSFMKMEKKRRGSAFNILFYMLVYLSIYPIILITSFYKLFRGNYKW